MPKANAAITLPQNGRIGRQGYKDADFKGYLTSVFNNAFQVNDDSVLFLNNGSYASPDISLLNPNSA
jgi:hypothetical protein